MGKPCKYKEETEKMKCDYVIPKEALEKSRECLRKRLERRGSSPKEIADVLGER